MSREDAESLEQYFLAGNVPYRGSALEVIIGQVLIEVFFVRARPQSAEEIFDAFSGQAVALFVLRMTAG